MNFPKMIMALGLIAAVASPAFAATSDEELEALCRGYAAEDGVKGDEVEPYVMDCMEELKKAEAEETAEDKKD